MQMNRLDEAEVLAQEVSEDELAFVWGGRSGAVGTCGLNSTAEGECLHNNERSIYSGYGFPNCALTVEDGSWCGENDSCFIDAVSYTGMNHCRKAWK